MTVPTDAASHRRKKSALPADPTLLRLDNSHNFAKASDAANEALQYIRFSSSEAVNDDVVFYETMSGQRISDSPLAMFDYLRSRPEYGRLTHVWSASSNAPVPKRFLGQEDVIIVQRGTESYAYFLACAGRVITNGALPSFFRRRPQQSVLNTWHGIPFKKIGRNLARTKLGGPAGATSTFIKSTHVISPCKYFTDAIASAYSLKGVSHARCAETGYPRIDVVLDSSPEQRDRVRLAVGLEAEGHSPERRPVVLCAPTWQWDEDVSTISQRRIADLDALSILDIELLYRGHHKTEALVADSAVGGSSRRVLIPPLSLSTSELLPVVDILITDYSSVFFDFLPTGRPVVHYLHDLDDFARTQGLYLSTDELPGSQAFDREQLVARVAAEVEHLRQAWPSRDFSQNPLQGEPYKRAQKRFCPHEDGGSTRRAVDFFFRDEASGISVTQFTEARHSEGFWMGALAKTLETEGFLAYAARHSTAKSSDFAVLYDNKSSRISTWSSNLMKQLRAQCATVPMRKMRPVLLPEEVDVYSAFVEQDSLVFSDAAAQIFENEILREVFSREYHRHLDEKQFDALHLAPTLSNHDLGLAVFALNLGAPPTPDSKPFSHLSPEEFGKLCASRVSALDSHQLQLLALQIKLDHTRSKASRMSEKIERQQTRLSSQRQRIERQSRMLTESKRQIESLKRQLSEHESSLSWRLTAPLRARGSRSEK
ncbi:CDP-glycerol glycerophosphotransferase family protein [Leucobacter sp. USHLN153]|uniref:CDP-glycerol glycerophosphotransferase family protein n=1 Tax=Leucobacter sp. USHLN153 TaxID=3081268 RepID=UPI00301946C3